MGTMLRSMKITCRARISSLMIMIAVLALILWSTETALNHYRDRAIKYRAIKSLRQQMVDWQTIQLRAAERSSSLTGDAQFSQWLINLKQHHSSLRQKYLKGVAEPWLDLGADPPPPVDPTNLQQMQLDADALLEKAKRIEEAFVK